MRILVTGAAGFVGQTLVRTLATAHQVTGIDRHGSSEAVPGVTLLQGDFADPDLLDAALAGGCDAAIHLATVPGGGAELDPRMAFDVNVTGSVRLIERVAAAGTVPRFIFASSIAVFGDSLPAPIDDGTPLQPRMVYGAHKAMVEHWVAAMTRRGAIAGMSLRLPGIVARPKGPSGMKSAFMSDVFHAVLAHEQFVAPVSREATMWLMSVACLVGNIVHALTAPLPAEPYALTLPALRTTMGALADEIARQAKGDAANLTYDPDPALEAGFGRLPPLTTPAADACGFRHDGTLETLVARAISTIQNEAIA